jgi:hypothetical protein
MVNSGEALPHAAVPARKTAELGSAFTPLPRAQKVAKMGGEGLTVQARGDGHAQLVLPVGGPGWGPLPPDAASIGYVDIPGGAVGPETQRAGEQPRQYPSASQKWEARSSGTRPRVSGGGAPRSVARMGTQTT